MCLKMYNVFFLLSVTALISTVYSVAVEQAETSEKEDATASSLAYIKNIQAALAFVQTLSLTTCRYPTNCTLINEKSFDFIIVGSGTAGSVLANRLSANSSYSVLLIEAGGYPPIESEIPGLFALLPGSVYDYDFESQNDGRSAQNLQKSRIRMTQGKMLGGSSALHHLIHVHGDPQGFNQWSKILDDDYWNYTNVQPYLKKVEKLVDGRLLNSSYAEIHGTEGMIKIDTQVSATDKKYLDAFKQLGHRIVPDLTSTVSTCGYTSPLYTVADNIRQSAAFSYLTPVKSRSNLCVAMSTTATKIIIKDGVAVGVQVTTSSGETYVLYANKEVLVSAGAINSPKLLMLSGIGPKTHLESLGIEVIADLPVGENFMDHQASIVVYQMEASTEPAPAANPYGFPTPTIVGAVALNSTQSYPDYQSILLVFPQNSEQQLQFCANVIKYSHKICNKLFDAANGRTTAFFVIHSMMPESRGHVLLASSDPNDDPLIFTGLHSNYLDLKLMGESLADVNKVLNTTYFKSVNATRVDLGICADYSTPKEFWECYALETSFSAWHYVGTCAMGKVLDSSLRVKGVQRLRVIDSSSMPTLVRGKTNAATAMIAERGADLILST